MCITCYRDYGSPQAFTAKVLQAIEILSDPFFPLYYGNALSVVTNDWDLRDDTIEQCRRKSLTSQQNRLAALLLSMTLPERSTALAVDQGMIELPESLAAAIHNDMETTITIEALIPLMFRGALWQAGEVIEDVPQDRARTLIQRGHAKPVPKVQQYETMAMARPEEAKKETVTRRRTPSKRSKKES